MGSKLRPEFSQQVAKYSIQQSMKSGRDNRYMRGSDVGNKCMRYLVYKISGYAELPFTGNTTHVLDLGNAVHDMLQLKLSKMGIVKAKPVWNEAHGFLDWEQTDDPKSGFELEVVDHNLKIFGHLDGITVPLKVDPKKTFPYYQDPNGERYLIEIKTISDLPKFWMLGILDGGEGMINEADYPSQFIDIGWETSKSSNQKQQRIAKFSHSRKVYNPKYGISEKPVYKLLNKNGKTELVTTLMFGNSIGAFTELSKPKEEHIMQASFYASRNSLKKVLFLYVAKDFNVHMYEDPDDLQNFPMKTFEYEVEDSIVESIAEKATEVHRHVNDEKLPPRQWESPDDNGAHCKNCAYRNQCHPKLYKEDELIANEMLIKLGMEPIKHGPWVKHEKTKDMKTVFENTAVK